MSITNIGLNECIDLIKDIEKKVNSPFENISDEIENLAVDNIKEKTPSITGHLRNGNDSRKISNDNIEIFNDVEYGKYVDSREEFFYLDDETQNKIEQEILDNIIKGD